MKKKDDKTESGPTFYQTPNGKFLPSVYASALGRYYPLGGKMGETSSQWYPTYSPLTYHFSNDVNRFGTEIGFTNPNIAGKKFFNKSGMTIPFSYTHHEDYGKGFGPALLGEQYGPGSNFAHFGAKNQQRFDEAKIGLLGKSIKSNIGGARGFVDVFGGYGSGPYAGIDAGAKWNLRDWGNKSQNHADTTLHLLNAQIGDKYGYSPTAKNQIYYNDFYAEEYKDLDKDLKLSPGLSFSPGISANVSHAVSNKKLKGLEFGAKGSAKFNIANQTKANPYGTQTVLSGNTGVSTGEQGQGQTGESGKFNFNPIIDFNAYARYRIPDRKKEDKKRIAEKEAKDRLIFSQVSLPRATGEGVDFSRPRESFSQPLWGGRPWHEVEMIPEGILNKSIYPYSESQFPYGGTFDMPRQQMYMPLDVVNAHGGYLAPILPMHFDKGTKIFRDTTALPFADGGKLMDFPAPSLSERETNINYNVYASMPGRYYSNGGKFLTAGGEYHRIYKNADGDIMVNHPAEDKGQWDTINLTNKSGANTIAEGVAATKQWHKENPNNYANGGMIKRADGSYSQRGLWDNIRANRGSGKEPTKEMLAQERKIKADSHAMGGNIVRASHLFGLGGHKAVFFPTNVSEPGAADKDLTYPKDAYVYANGGHLYPNGGTICPEGYFYDEETKSCQPILQDQQIVSRFRSNSGDPEFTLKELKEKNPAFYNKLIQSKYYKENPELLDIKYGEGNNPFKYSTIMNKIYWKGITKLANDLNNVKNYVNPKDDSDYVTFTNYPELGYSVKIDKGNPERFDEKTKTLYVPSENNFYYKKVAEYNLIKNARKEQEDDLIKKGYKLDITPLHSHPHQFNNVYDFDKNQYVTDSSGKFIIDNERQKFHDLGEESEGQDVNFTDPYWLPAELKGKSYEEFYKKRRAENKQLVAKQCEDCAYTQNAGYSYDNDYAYRGPAKFPKKFSIKDWENIIKVDPKKGENLYNIKEMRSAVQGVPPFPPEVMKVPTEKILPRNLVTPEASRKTQWKQNPITGTWYEDESYDSINNNTPWTDERPLGMESYNLNTGTYWTDEDAKKWQQQELKKQAEEAQKKSGQFNTITVPEGFANGGHLYDEGGPVYTYAGRPNAKYRKENDKWLISIDGGNKFKPIYDPKGERTALLNAQAKPIITTNYDPLAFNQISDNIRTVIPNQAVSAMNTHIYMESPEYKARQKAEKEAQAKFEKEQWNKYKNASTLVKVGDRVSAFATDPLGMTSRAIVGEQGYIPGMGTGLTNYDDPDRERYLKAVGYTPGQFELSDVQNMINPGYWASSAGTKFATGHPVAGATELGLMALGLKGGMPGVNTGRQAAKVLNATPEYLTTQTPLRNAYKINPFAFKPNETNWYRQVGKSAIDDAFNTGIVREAGEEVSPRMFQEFQDQLVKMQGSGMDAALASRRPASPFFGKGELFYPMGRKPTINKVTGKLSKNPAGKGSADYLIETALPNESFQPAYVKGMGLGVPTETGVTAILKPDPSLRKLENFNIYKKDWLRGYKQIKTPTTILNLPKLEQIPLPEFSLEKFNQFSPLHKEIRKEAKEYFKLATSKENYERAAALDAAEGTEYVKALDGLKKQYDKFEKNININKLPFNIKTIPDDGSGSGGWSTLTQEGKIKKLALDNNINTGIKLPALNIDDREISIMNNAPLEDVRRRVHHEIKHHYTFGQSPNFYENSYGNSLSDMLYNPGEISKTNPKFADELIQPAFKDDSKTLFEYLEEPHEIDAYVNTNLRDELVKDGTLKNHWEELTDDKIAEHLMKNPAKHSKKYLDLVKSPEFIKNFNKGVYTIGIPTTIGTGIMTNQKQYGGHMPTEKTIIRTSELFK